MHRRNLFKAGALTALAGVAAPARGAPEGTAGRKQPFKISLAEWSLHRSLQGKKVEHLDFAKIANGLGIDGVEYVNSFFKDKAQRSRLPVRDEAPGGGRGGVEPAHHD